MILCHGDKVLEGEIAGPDGPGPHPAVLVIHNAFGLGERVRETALRLAERRRKTPMRAGR